MIEVMNNSREERNSASPSGSQLSSTVADCCSSDERTRKMFWCKSFNIYWQLALLLLAAVIYLLIGGAIFSAVEGPHEQMQLKQTHLDRETARANLTTMVANWTNLTEEEVQDLVSSVIHLGEKASKEIPPPHKIKWNFWSAVFFASTVITTVGYGTLAPSTANGQIIFIVYTIIGVPIAFVFLGLLGSLVMKLTHTLLRLVLRKPSTRQIRIFSMLVLFAAILVLFVIIPGAVFSDIETWNFREGVYFAITSLTTVGFGDFVPAQVGSESSSALNYLYKILSAVWLWLGLAIVGALLSELQGLVVALGRKCHTHKYQKLSEE